jgi:hypothetical protein
MLLIIIFSYNKSSQSILIVLKSLSSFNTYQSFQNYQQTIKKCIRVIETSHFCLSIISEVNLVSTLPWFRFCFDRWLSSYFTNQFFSVWLNFFHDKKKLLSFHLFMAEKLYLHYLLKRMFDQSRVCFVIVFGVHTESCQKSLWGNFWY